MTEPGSTFRPETDNLAMLIWLQMTREERLRDRRATPVVERKRQEKRPRPRS